MPVSCPPESQSLGVSRVYHRCQEFLASHSGILLRGRLIIISPLFETSQTRSFVSSGSSQSTKLQKEESKSRRSKGWAKPDRELTPTEKKRKDRQDKKEQESQKHFGQPSEILPFVFSFLWPKEMSVATMLGGNLQALNSVRAEFGSFIWMEKHRDDVVGYPFTLALRPMDLFGSEC